mmetsp:Transcript_44256/g.87116  ORF Transcript_44256/g.87116 Transcript_44256/m.87116 type:complete len:261 (-) Transcript_44256:239-1021(-)
MQVQGAAKVMKNGLDSMTVYRNPFHAARMMLVNEGVASFYVGLGAVLASAAPAQALYFAGLETFKVVLPAHPASSFVAGVGAQLCGSVAWVPMDVIKERLQVQGAFKGDALSARYSGSAGALRAILKTEGVAGLYRAYWIHQMTWCPFNGLYFMIYDSSKAAIQSRGMSKQWESACAPLAGVVASFATNPMDLVKTRLQVAASNPALFDYTSSSDALVKIVRREGAAALMDGALSRVLLLTPRLSIAVLSYEYVKGAWEA